MRKKLVYAVAGGGEVKVGDVVISRGEKLRVTGWQEPRHAGSSGRVHVHVVAAGTEYDATYYPAVIRAKWVEVEDEEPPTPIELLCEQLMCETGPTAMCAVEEILVPEQCAMVTIGDKVYHVTVAELTEREGE